MWQAKAQQIIAALCLAAYRQANYLPNGRKRAKHVPYVVPAEARALVDCLNRDDEIGAKSLMMHDYTIQQTRNAERI